jgi:hypothetical protein
MRARRIDHFWFDPALVHFEGVTLVQDDRAFHDVLQLADITRPTVSLQLLERAFGETSEILARAFGESSHKVLHQQWNVFRSLTQRRSDDGKDVQPVIKILTEGSGRIFSTG